MAARGLDIEDCDAVLNLELPSNASAYAHRAGRTGRLGRCGQQAIPDECRNLYVSASNALRCIVTTDVLVHHAVQAGDGHFNCSACGALRGQEAGSRAGPKHS